jgi:hypothetical protein
VRYEELAPMLLNEVQKQAAEIRQLKQQQKKFATQIELNDLKQQLQAALAALQSIEEIVISTPRGVSELALSRRMFRTVQAEVCENCTPSRGYYENGISHSRVRVNDFHDNSPGQGLQRHQLPRSRGC